MALTHTAACVGFELGFGGGWRECVVRRLFIIILSELRWFFEFLTGWFFVEPPISLAVFRPRFSISANPKRQFLFYLSAKIGAEFFGADAPLESYFPGFSTISQAKTAILILYYLPKSERNFFGANAPHKSYFPKF